MARITIAERLTRAFQVSGTPSSSCDSVVIVVLAVVTAQNLLVPLYNAIGSNLLNSFWDDVLQSAYRREKLHRF